MPTKKNVSKEIMNDHVDLIMPTSDHDIGENDPSDSTTTVPTLSFSDMALPKQLINALHRAQIFNPTPIQVGAIPPALENKDILGSAQTGTGKTLAFLLPLITKLLEFPQKKGLILAPTRELAQQVIQAAKRLIGDFPKLKIALLIGGESFSKQIFALRRNPQLIIGTPGRVIDHLEQETLKGDEFCYLVLDEMDRMLDMGFSIQLDAILEFMPSKRQTWMFSATMPDEIIKLAKNYLTDPLRVSLGSVSAPAPKVVQEVIYVKENEKFTRLLEEIEKREGTIIIFVKTKQFADDLASELNEDEHSVCALHGDLRQGKRDRIIQAFRKGRYRIMVATDIAARGLDIPHIQHVINYDLPQNSDDYIHRIGRTARAGAEGHALCIVTAKDRRRWEEIEYAISPDKEKAKKPQGHRNSNGRNASGNRNSRGKGFNSSFGDRSKKEFGQGKRFGSGSQQREGFGNRSSNDSQDRPRRFGEHSSGPREERFARNNHTGGRAAKPRTDYAKQDGTWQDRAPAQRSRVDGNSRFRDADNFGNRSAPRAERPYKMYDAPESRTGLGGRRERFGNNNGSSPARYRGESSPHAAPFKQERSFSHSKGNREKLGLKTDKGNTGGFARRKKASSEG